MGATGLGSAWTRRQFVARGSAVAAALAVYGQLPQQAAADTPPALSGEELAVAAALVSAVLAAVGQPESQAAALGLQSPAALAAGYATLDGDSQAAVVYVLDAIDQAPSSGTFVSLSPADRGTLIASTLAVLQPPPASASDVQNMDSLVADVSAAYPAVLAAIKAGSVPLSVPVQSGPEAPDAPPGPDELDPPTPDPPPQIVLAETMLAGLRLVSQPLELPSVPPDTPPLSVSVAASRVTFALGSLPGAVVPQPLVDEILADLNGPEAEISDQPELPAAVLGDALTHWILNG